MPFDEREFPDIEKLGGLRRDRRHVATWLFTVAFMIWVMVALGGVTRLTGSGLSIMEWAPLTGALPPLSGAEWDRLFHLYQQTPQYALVNDGIGIEGFKRIFWLEWAHRLWGRLIGIAFALPLVFLAWRGAIERRLIPRLVLLLALGGLQGAVGWFMVASGFFPDATAVSPYRLVIHLTLALALYAAIVWTALGVLRPHPTPVPAGNAARRLAGASSALVALTIVAGGFTAGLHAGLIDETFPLMDGHLVPTGWASLAPAWRNLTENPEAVQFDHRLLATLTALAALGTVIAARRVRPAVFVLGGAIALQYALGVLTLVNAVPIPLAVLHQAGAVLLLTASLCLLHRLRA